MKSLLEFPSLFYFKDWKRTRQEFLDHLFLVIGNGFAWHKTLGIMVKKAGNMWFDSQEGWKADGNVYEDIPTIILTKDNFREILEQLPREDFAYKRAEKFGYKEWDPYGLEYKGKIFYLPDNIEPSWLAGAEEIIGYCYEYYEVHNDKKALDLVYQVDKRINELKNGRFK